MAEQQRESTSSSGLKRSLTLLDATLIVAGSMIGSGIFIVSADMSRILGSSGWLLFAWVLAGIITVTAALSYGELAGMMPKAGGQYTYLQRAYSPLISFVYGWTVFSVIQTGTIAAVAVAFAKFTAVFFPFFSPDNKLVQIGAFSISTAQLLAIASIILLTFLNSRGIHHGKFIQRLFTIAKITALLALIVIGLAAGLQTDVLAHNFANPFSANSVDAHGLQTALYGGALLAALGVSMIGSLFSSDAWNNVTFIAGEIQQPQRNIPLGLFFGTLIVTVLYLLVNISYLSLLPLEGSPIATDVLGRGIQFAEQDRVATAAISVVLGNAAVYLMAALIMVSTFGCNNGIILAGARLYYAMAHDGLFFKKAAELNQNAVPGFALWVQCIWASLLCLSGTYGDLLDYTTFASLLFYIVTIAGIFILRRREPNAERPYRAFGYPVLPALYIVVATAICLNLLVFKTQNTGMGLLIVLLGVPVFYLTQRQKRTA